MANSEELPLLLIDFTITSLLTTPLPTDQKTIVNKNGTTVKTLYNALLDMARYFAFTVFGKYVQHNRYTGAMATKLSQLE